MKRVFAYPMSDIYPLYLNKVERKGRTQEELNATLTWLTGYSETELTQHVQQGTTLEDFFAGATMNPHVDAIKGVVCGVRVEEIEDPLMQKIRWMDKIVDELARGKALEKVLRG